MHAEATIRSRSALNGNIDANLLRSVEECVDCTQTCTSCADACLGENAVSDLPQCIRLNLDCADLCTAITAIASRRTGSNDSVLRAAILVVAMLARPARLSANATHRRTNPAVFAPSPADLARQASTTAAKGIKLSSH